MSAKNPSGFDDYIKENDLYLPAESMVIIREYIGKDYSFVIIWITDFNKFMFENEVAKNSSTNFIGVYVKFPYEKIYFPLKPASVYGANVVPVSIYVLGHVTPEIYLEIKNYTKIDYLIGNYNPKIQKPEIAEFFNHRTRIVNLEFTRININSPSSNFKDDLWVVPTAPESVLIKKLYVENYFVIGLIVFIVASMLGSLLSGLFVFRNNSPSVLKFALLGLANLLSFLGFCIASYLLKVDQSFAKAKIDFVSKKDFVKPIFFPFAATFFVIFGIISIYSLTFGLYHFPILMSDSIIFSFFLAVLMTINVLPVSYAFFNGNKKLANFFGLFPIFFLSISFLALHLIGTFL